MNTSFERKLFALSNAVSCKVVQRIGRELFDLKARGDIFFNHPIYIFCLVPIYVEENVFLHLLPYILSSWKFLN